MELSPLPPQLLSKGAFGYLLPIVSFVLAWLETWFLDFKVLPQEAEEERCESWGRGAGRVIAAPRVESFGHESQFGAILATLNSLPDRA